MKIIIHSGSHQIGGSCTEYEENGWHLFVDYGAPLPDATTTEQMGPIEGLNSGDRSKSALFITHNHGDHIGMIGDLPPDVRIYMGESCREIQKQFSERMSQAIQLDTALIERNKCILAKLSSACTFRNNQKLEFGPFQIRPIKMDHSAFDAYGFYIQTEGIKVFHTGDFRLTGGESAVSTLENLRTLGHVDYLVCEATNIHRHKESQLPANEDELQQEFARAFQENKFNVVYVASTNITRIFGIYRAAVQTGRVFLVDKYQKTIMDIINNYKTSAPYYHYDENHEPMELFPDFKVVPKFINLLTKQGYVLIARANPQFDTFKKEIPGPQTTYLSMWQGYMQSGPAANAALQASIDDTYLYMHVSGHCTVDDLKKLMELLQPHTVIPMHTDDPEQVRLELGDKVRVLQDGEALTLNSCQK